MINVIAIAIGVIAVISGGVIAMINVISMIFGTESSRENDRKYMFEIHSNGMIFLKVCFS